MNEQPFRDVLTSEMDAADAQIQRLESLAAKGETALTVELPDLIAMHRFTRALLDALRAAHELSQHLGGRTLASLVRPTATKLTGKPGRPGKYRDKFLSTLAAHVDKMEGRTLRARLNAAALEYVTDAYPDRATRKLKMAAITCAWYRPLSAFRVANGKRLKAATKFKTKPKDSGNSNPFSGIWGVPASPYVQQPPLRGKEIRSDDDSYSTPRRKGARRPKP